MLNELQELRFHDFYADNVELVGLITGVLSVLLLIFTRYPRLQWIAWPAGVINAAVYFYLFYEWGLYGNFILQVPFLLISLQGMWLWRGQLRGIVSDVEEVPTTWANMPEFGLVMLTALTLMFPVYPILAYYNDPSPLWDGLILTLSLGAIFMQLRKQVQSWFLWIAVDIIAVPFHWTNDHHATSVLYFVYGVMCLFGLYTWWRDTSRNVIVSDTNEETVNPLRGDRSLWTTKNG